MSKNQTAYMVTFPDGSEHYIEERWTVSKGRDTYGYNICTLRENGKKIASCNGGGYDMRGTVFGVLVMKHCAEQLKGLAANYGSGDNTDGFYGLRFWKTADGHSECPNHWEPGCKISVDGACGMSSVERIAAACGMYFKRLN
jgi:hypothetical protein